MNVQVLLSTMNQQNYSLLEKMQIDTDIVVVNQCERDSEDNFTFNGHHVKWINSTTRGLSISRNICLVNATGDICLLADDDMFYVKNYESIIKNAFIDNPEYSIIRFKVDGIEKPFKKYIRKEQNITFLNSLKVSSVEIAFMRENVLGIWFDEIIGSGTHFYMGEENAFITECLRKGLKIKYIPKTIIKLHVGDSSWYNGMNEQYMISRGAAFEAMNTRVTDYLIFQFAVRKYKRYKDKLSFIKAIKLMKEGKRQYLNEKRKIRHD